MIQEYQLLLILIFLISQINSQLFKTVSIINSRAVDIKLPQQLNHSVLHLIHPNYVFFLSNSVEAQPTHMHQPHRQTLPNINPHTFNLTNLTINTRLRAKIYYSLTSHHWHFVQIYEGRFSVVGAGKNSCPAPSLGHPIRRTA